MPLASRPCFPNGEILVVTEEQPELLQAFRTSFGLLGLVYEVTFRVKPLKPMAVYHENLRLDDFLRRLPELRGRGESMMYYLFPFKDRITVDTGARSRAVAHRRGAACTGCEILPGGRSLRDSPQQCARPSRRRPCATPCTTVPTWYRVR